MYTAPHLHLHACMPAQMQHHNTEEAAEEKQQQECYKISIEPVLITHECMCSGSWCRVFCAAVMCMCNKVNGMRREEYCFLATRCIVSWLPRRFLPSRAVRLAERLHLWTLPQPLPWPRLQHRLHLLLWPLLQPRTPFLLTSMKRTPTKNFSKVLLLFDFALLDTAIIVISCSENSSAYMPWQFRLSVCLSHGWISQKWLKQFSPYSSSIPLVFRG